MPPRHPLMSRLLERQTELFQQASLLFSPKSQPLSIRRRAISRNSAAAQRCTLSTCPSSSLVRTPPLKHRTNGRATSTVHSLPRVRIARRFNSSKADPSKSEPRSLSQRLRQLSREYGWSALGVYLLLSALDFPLCFAAVRLLGVDRIGYYEHVTVETVKSAVRAVWPFSGAREPRTEDDKDTDRHTIDHGVAEAEKRNSGEGASIWTQLALAYAIHKSFIFLRVPLTAAVTPKVVKLLRRWGWDIGKRKPKSG